MTIDFSTLGKVQLSMPDFVKEIVEQLPDALRTGPSTTPAGNHLFQTNERAIKLSVEDAELFHRLTAQLLYLCK